MTVVNLLVSLELRERVDALDQATEALREIIDRWSSTDLCVVADSSFHIHHPVKLKDVDLAEVVDFDRGYVRLLVPMVVIDELDGLKESGPYERYPASCSDRPPCTRPPCRAANQALHRPGPRLRASPLRAPRALRRTAARPRRRSRRTSPRCR